MMDCSDNILDAEQGQTKRVKVDFVTSKSRTRSSNGLQGEIPNVDLAEWHSKEDCQQALATG